MGLTGYTGFMSFEPSETVKTVSYAIICAGAAQGLFLGTLFLIRAARRDRHGRRPDLLLAALMVVFTVNILHAAFFRPFFLAHSQIRSVLEPFQLLFGPLVYAYVRSVVVPERGRRPVCRVLPVLLVFAGITVFFSLTGILFAPNPFALRLADACAWIVTLAWLFHYLAKTMRMIHEHQKRARDEFADVGEIDFSWIRVFIVVFISLEAVWALLLVWIIHARLSAHFAYVSAILSSVVVYALGFRALLQKNVVELPRDGSGAAGTIGADVRGGGADAGGENEKYARSVLGDRELGMLKDDLLSLMKLEKPWLDPEVNLQTLADRCGMSRHTLTEVLNRACSANFYDFVNGYRVEEFKRLLSLPGSEKFNMLGLAMDSGFNSKGTFIAAFKKSTGMTPSAWRASGKPPR